MPGRHLGNAVLDLDARIHFEEEVLAIGEQPLDRAGAAVADSARGVGRDLADPLAQRGIDDPRRCGRLLDQLLVASLDRAVPLAEVNDATVGVGEHLDFDVARIGHVALEVDGRVTEELLTLANRPLEGGFELGLTERHSEALTAAAAGGLDGDGPADFRLDDLSRVLDAPDRLRGAGHDRDAGRCHQRARPRLRAHRLDRACGRADEDDPCLLASRREGGVLGEEAVAGMHRLSARLAGHGEDPVDVQVALGRSRAAQQVGAAGAPHVCGVAIAARSRPRRSRSRVRPARG